MRKVRSPKQCRKACSYSFKTDWIFNNRVFTVLSFDGIPPFATTCELIIEIPPETLLWQVAISVRDLVDAFSSSIILSEV